MSDPDGLKIARRLIAEEAERKTGFLDLGMLGLTSLPPEIRQLDHLRRLSLGRFYTYDDGEVVESCNRVGHNTFISEEDWRLNFADLDCLFLRECNIRNIEPIAELNSIRQLDCARTPVDDLSPLKTIANLEILNCGATLKPLLPPI